jgi:hypothetical protein
MIFSETSVCIRTTWLYIPENGKIHNYRCETPEVTFLGYKVSAESSRPLEERVAHLQDCPPPKTISQLRRFLGMLNFYRRFLPQASAPQTPLNDVLFGPRVKGSHPFAWTPELHKAFEECKASLSLPQVTSEAIW